MNLCSSTDGPHPPLMQPNLQHLKMTEKETSFMSIENNEHSGQSGFIQQRIGANVD